MSSGGCETVVLHSRVAGADDYVIAGSGVWQGECGELLTDFCFIRFAAPPPAPICDFTVSAVRDGVVGLPSRTFCVRAIGFN